MALLDSTRAWRFVSVFFFIVICLQSLWISKSRYSPAIASPVREPTNFLQQQSHAAWLYEPERDARNTGLSQAQCDDAFPELYYEIDRATSYWKQRGHTITQEDTEISWRNDAAIRLLIHDNQLRILEVRKAWFRNPYRIRVLYVLLQLHRALLGATVAGESVPDAEFAVVVDDMSLIPGGEDDTHSVWTFTRHVRDHAQEKLWLMPDFMFFASPPVATAYSEMQLRAKVHDAPLADKIRKVVWRGVTKTNEFVRGHLIDATEGKEWADVVGINWKDDDADIIAMEDFCRYMFVAHTEGRSWSGRLKFLLNCDSIPIVHDLDWTTSFYHLFTPEGPEQNYINVKRDWSDLEGKVAHYLENMDKAQRIANNSVSRFRSKYTSPAAEACYLRRLIHSWTSVAFTPEPFEAVTSEISGTTLEKQQLRGTAFEEFVYISNDEMS